MRIAFDVFGGDNCPAAAIEGCIEFLETSGGSDTDVVLVGDESLIRKELEQRGYDNSQISIAHAPEVVGYDEAPSLAIKKKANSSMMTALRLVAENSADCVVSSGSTGALLTGATFIVKRIKGVKRPALAPLLPTMTGGLMLLVDAGANTDCKPEYLKQFAVMGSKYMSAIAGIENPRVALLSNGAEECKGNDLVREAYEIIKDSQLNFIGNREGNSVLAGDVDVLVCDGFSGNVFLKASEGAIKLFTNAMKDALTSSVRSKVGGALVKSRLVELRRRFDHRETGGAILLGVNGGVIKAHGSSDMKAFCNALRLARRYSSGHVTELIAQALQENPGKND